MILITGRDLNISIKSNEKTQPQNVIVCFLTYYTYNWFGLFSSKYSQLLQNMKLKKQTVKKEVRTGEVIDKKFIEGILEILLWMIRVLQETPYLPLYVM